MPFRAAGRELDGAARCALIMRTDPELAIYGRYCVSRCLREEGFDFMFPDVASALRRLVRLGGSQWMRDEGLGTRSTAETRRRRDGIFAPPRLCGEP